jgi:hypothetical protein
MRYETIIQLDDVDIDVICEWDREYIGWMEISQLSIAGIDVTHLLDDRHEEIETLIFKNLAEDEENSNNNRRSRH